MNYVVEYWNGSSDWEVVFMGSEKECCEWEEKNNFVGSMNLDEEGMEMRRYKI